MRNYEIKGNNIEISPKIEDKNVLNKINKLSNVYLIKHTQSMTIICLLNNPTKLIGNKIIEDKEQIKEIIKTRNLLPKLMN